jgi:hypothetical protein
LKFDKSIKQKQIKMKNLESLKSLQARELMLQIADMDENSNPFLVAASLMQALRYETITASQYEMLVNDFQRECKIYNLETRNEICSLF